MGKFSYITQFSTQPVIVQLQLLDSLPNELCPQCLS